MWSYTSVDAGIRLFTACLETGAPMTFTPGMKVLEAACVEEDWLLRAAEEWPKVVFWGCDYRLKGLKTGPNWIKSHGNLLDPDLYPKDSFDGVVSLSAIEHIGLGHYDDPIDPDGDTKAVANIRGWLKPGGWFYFDVPYNPEGYSVFGTECRIYDDAALNERLLRPFLPLSWPERGQFYVDSKDPGTLISKPTKAAERYWYVATCWKKA